MYIFFIDCLKDMHRLCSSSRLFLWMAPWTLAMITLRGLTMSLCAGFSIRGLYLFSLEWMAWVMSLLWVNVDLTICMERLGVGHSGHVCYGMAPCMFMMFVDNSVRHAHFKVPHL